VSTVLASLWQWLARLASEAGPDPAGDRWVVVDTETTGTDPRRDRLLAIGGVAVDSRGVALADSFELVIEAEGVGLPENILIHGIGHGAQAEGVPPVAALHAFRHWVADAPLIGFHADFDRMVLRRAFAGAGIAFPERPWLDVAALAAALLPDAARYGGRGLDDWLLAFGIDALLRHNAAADALATAQLLLCLRSIAAAQGASGHLRLWRLARQGRWLGASRH
jgi:DNA polymerase-3 subunit epsilon